MYSIRDLRGHFVKPVSREGKKCLHKCCGGRREHPAGTPLLPDRDVLRAMSDKQIEKSIDWDDDESLIRFLGELNRREKAANAEKSATERRKAKFAREKEEHYLAVHNAFLAAETETRGHMLSPAGKAANIDPISLFTGPAARVSKYGSEELRDYFDQTGGRMTVTEYRRHLATERSAYEEADRSRKVRERKRQAAAPAPAPARPPKKLETGDVVKVGFGSAEILREERKHRQDGFIVQDVDSQNGYGSVRRGLPRWVPTSAVSRLYGVY